MVVFKRNEKLRVDSAGEQHYYASGELEQGKFVLYWPERGVAEYNGEIKSINSIDLEKIIEQ